MHQTAQIINRVLPILLLLLLATRYIAARFGPNIPIDAQRSKRINENSPAGIWELFYAQQAIVLFEIN